MVEVQPVQGHVAGGQSHVQLREVEIGRQERAQQTLQHELVEALQGIEEGRHRRAVARQWGQTGLGGEEAVGSGVVERPRSLVRAKSRAEA